MTEPLLGRSINRLEDERFVQGRGRYIADLAAPNALHGVVVRSTHAHARIAAIRVDAARQMPGVAAVLTGTGIGFRQYWPAALRGDQYPDDHAARGPALSRAGARRRSLCRRARSPSWSRKAPKARAMPPRLSPLTTSRCRRWSRSPMPFCRAPRRSGRRHKTTSRSNSTAARSAPVEAAIRSAAHVVECELVNNRVVAAPLETRGALGEFDAVERPSAPDRLGRRRARASATCSPTPCFVSPVKNFASAFPTSAAASG